MDEKCGDTTANGWVCDDPKGHAGYHHMHCENGVLCGWSRNKNREIIMRDRRDGKNEIWEI